MAVWAQRDAHEGRRSHEHPEGVADGIYVLAAAQWIIWYGQSLFKQLLYPGEVSSDDLRNSSPGPKYSGKPNLTLHRWHYWKGEYNAVASSGARVGKEYSQECRDVSARVVAIMDALEKSDL